MHPLHSVDDARASSLPRRAIGDLYIGGSYTGPAPVSSHSLRSRDATRDGRDATRLDFCGDSGTAERGVRRSRVRGISICTYHREVDQPRCTPWISRTGRDRVCVCVCARVYTCVRDADGQTQCSVRTRLACPFFFSRFSLFPSSSSLLTPRLFYTRLIDQIDLGTVKCVSLLFFHYFRSDAYIKEITLAPHFSYFNSPTSVSPYWYNFFYRSYVLIRDIKVRKENGGRHAGLRLCDVDRLHFAAIAHSASLTIKRRKKKETIFPRWIWIFIPKRVVFQP